MKGAGAGQGRPRHPDVLTPAEWQVAHAVRHGMTNRQIAQRRGVSVDAVKFHLANALGKLGLVGRAALRDWPGVPADSALGKQAGGRGMSDEGEVRLGPIGQVSRQVSDIDAAVHWYGTVLGLPHLYTYGDLAFFDCAGVRLFLSAGREGAARQPESVLYFRVADIHDSYARLQSRGVEFRGAPHLIHRHESGEEEWMAFFDDPDGQLLAIMSQVPAPAPEASADLDG